MEKTVNFRTLVFTSPEEISEEKEKIIKLLENGVDFVHIRKPRFNTDRMRAFIASIDPYYHTRLKLHDFFELSKEFDLGGIHLNSRNPIGPAEARNISISLHSIEEIKKLQSPQMFDYVTLSPIFDSISKKGYYSTFSLKELSVPESFPPVIALGGVTPEKFNFLRNKGFSGAALLGYIWNDQFNQRVKALKIAVDQINQIN